jgi:hypothetical protein
MCHRRHCRAEPLAGFSVCAGAGAGAEPVCCRAVVAGCLFAQRLSYYNSHTHEFGIAPMFMSKVYGRKQNIEQNGKWSRG